MRLNPGSHRTVAGSHKWGTPPRFDYQLKEGVVMNGFVSNERARAQQVQRKRRRKVPWRSILLLLSLANLIIPLALYVNFQRQVRHLDQLNQQLAGEVASLQQSLAAVEAEYAGRAELASLQADVRKQTLTLDRVMQNQQFLVAEISAPPGGVARLTRAQAPPARNTHEQSPAPAAGLGLPAPSAFPVRPAPTADPELMEAVGRTTVWGTLAAGATYYGGKLLYAITQVARMHPAIP